MRRQSIIVTVAVAVVLALGLLVAAWPKRRFGHFRYHVAAEAELRPVDAARTVRLAAPAARAFIAMRDAAARQGVVLVPVSGHRTVAHQTRKFVVETQADGRRPDAERAMDVAPPGFSEHHTGYTIDLDDGSHGKGQRIEGSFDQTISYAWLVRNAARYGFEESFPADNPQGVAYEPWHWRWRGDLESRVTFLPARLHAALARLFD